MSGDRYIISDQNGMYFITFTVVGWLDVFIRRNYKEVIAESLNYCIENKGLIVHAWCLMTSHIHLIISAKEGYSLSEIIRDFKKHTAKKIIKLILEEPESRRESLIWYFEREGKKDRRITKYKFWKEDNHAIYLHPSEVKIIDQKITYIHQNPIESGIVAEESDYLYSSASDYSGKRGLVKIAFI